MLKVKITLEDNGKKAELEIEEVDNLSKLVIIQSVFNLFGVDANVVEMTSTYQKIGEAYKNFFESVSPVENRNIIDVETNTNEIRDELTNGLIQQHEEENAVHKEDPEWFITGVKDRDSKKTYKTFYRCPVCYDKATRYVPDTATKTWCLRCGYEMKVSSAHPKGFPNRDSFGNFMRAGDWYDYSLNWSK